MSVACARFGLYKAHDLLLVTGICCAWQLEFRPKVNFDIKASSEFQALRLTRLERCGRRRFSVAGPFLWNKLPASVKSANSLGAFKSALKTHLFREAFMTLL